MTGFFSKIMQSRAWKYSRKNCCTEAKDPKDFGSMGPHFSLWTLFHTKSYKRIFDKSKTLYQSIIYKHIILPILTFLPNSAFPNKSSDIASIYLFFTNRFKRRLQTRKNLVISVTKTAYSPWYLPDNGSIRENVDPWTLRIRPEHILWPIRAQITHKNQKKERKSKGPANKK